MDSRKLKPMRTIHVKVSDKGLRLHFQNKMAADMAEVIILSPEEVEVKPMGITKLVNKKGIPSQEKSDSPTVAASLVHDLRSLLSAIDGLGKLASLRIDTNPNKAKNLLSQQQESIIHLNDHLLKLLQTDS